MLIACPSCGKHFRPKGAKAGKRYRCSRCRAVFRLVPGGEGSVGRLKVLIAEESALFCQRLAELLAAEPFEVTTCRDGAAALAAAEKLCPDLLLLDVALPGMPGFQLCEKLKEDPRYAGLKIVLIASTYDETRYRRPPVSLYGADAYIERHRIAEELLPMLHRLMDHQPRADARQERETASQS